MTMPACSVRRRPSRRRRIGAGTAPRFRPGATRNGQRLVEPQPRVELATMIRAREVLVRRGDSVAVAGPHRSAQRAHQRDRRRLFRGGVARRRTEGLRSPRRRDPRAAARSPSHHQGEHRRRRTGDPRTACRPTLTLLPPDHSPVVRNLLDAGAIIVGRTNTPELSMRATTGQTRCADAPSILGTLTRRRAGLPAGRRPLLRWGSGRFTTATISAARCAFPSFACGLATVEADPRAGARVQSECHGRAWPSRPA